MEDNQQRYVLLVVSSIATVAVGPFDTIEEAERHIDFSVAPPRDIAVIPLVSWDDHNIVTLED